MNTDAVAALMRLGEDRRRWIGMLTHAALDSLWQAGEDGCDPAGCAPCAALKGMLDAGELDEWVQAWPDDLAGTAWWTDGNEVDRAWLARVWHTAPPALGS